MNYTIYILSFMCFLISNSDLLAQRNIEENIALSSSKVLELNLKYATSISIKSSEGNQARVLVSVDIDNNTDNERFTLEVEEGKDRVIVSSALEDLNKVLKSKTLIAPKPKNYYNHYNMNEAYLVVNGTYLEAIIEYEVFLPKQAKFSINTMSGNIQYDYDNQEADLKSMSGSITLLVDKSTNLNFKLRTMSGDIYTNLPLQFPESSSEEGLDRIGGGRSSKISQAKLGKGGKLLTLKSMSGNIFLKKK